MAKNKIVKLALYDFDGTLCAHDSVVEFWKYCFKHSIRPWAFLPMIGFYGLLGGLNLISKNYMNQRMLCFLTPDMITRFVPDFIREHKRNIFGWAHERVKNDQESGLTAICISASRNYLIHPLTADFGFDLVMCSNMDPDEPWRAIGDLCLGAEKVNRLNAWAKQRGIEYRVVRAYSDSKKDLPMMRLAGEQIWVDPKTGIRK